MNYLKKLQLFYILLFSNMFWSQGLLYDYLSSDKTPTPYSFEKYNFLGEDLSRGLLNISIPLYEIKSGSITVPIQLNYNAGGIKVDEIASNVGLGWNLQAGGTVIREIKDLEDHEIQQIYKEGFISNYSPKLLKNLGYFMKPEDLNSPGTSNTIFSDIAKIDASPDLFLANAPGLTSKFYLESYNRGSNPNDFYNNESTYTIKFLNGSADKGEIVTRKRLNGLTSNGFLTSEIQGFPESLQGVHGLFQNNQTPMDYESFVITNSQGLRFSFNKPDFTESISSFSSPTQFIRREENSSYSDNIVLNAYAAGLYRLRANSWGLSEINDPNTGQSVTFSYHSYNKPLTKVFPTNIKNNRYTDGSYRTPTCNSIDFIPEYTDTHGQNSGYCPVCELRVRNPKFYLKLPQVNRISEINWGQGKVIFYYENQRLDDLNENSLTKIKVFDKTGNAIITYFFNYSYFISKENCSEWYCKRLRLDNIEILENNERKLLYSFDYYYDNPLPKVNSLEHDFFGYYNNNGSTIGNTIETLKSPKLYFRAMKSKYSILPFPLIGSKEISGDYSLLANEYSLTGLIKKITNSSGGSNEFIYENHDFMIDNEMIKGGGARIKTQILNDGNNKRYLHYEYNDYNNPSSGKINNIPIFGYSDSNDATGINNFISYTNIQNNSDTKITYSRVIKREVGVGFIENIYSTFPDIDIQNENNVCTNCFFENSAFGKGLYNEDNSILNSKILKENVYDINQNVLISTTYSYTSKLLSNLPLNFQDAIERGSCSQIYFAGSVYTVLPYRSNLKNQRNLLTQKTTTEYFKSGSKTTIENFIYDEIYPFVKEYKINDQIGEFKKKYFFPFDTEINSFPYVSNLVNLNKIESPLKSETYKDGLKIDEQYTEYANDASTSNMCLPKYIFIKKGDSENILEKKLTYNLFDNKGNLIQYTPENSNPVSIIWGYNQTQPVAIINGIDYNSINSNLITSIQYATNSVLLDENNVLTALTNLRNSLPEGTLVSTYTYKPLIGISTIIDSKGDIQYYEYDSRNRLKYIRDKNNFILKEYNYYNRPNITNQNVEENIQDIIVNFNNIYNDGFSIDWQIELNVISTINYASGNYIYRWYYETSNNNYVLFSQTNANPTFLSSFNALNNQYPGFSSTNKLKCEILNTLTGNIISFIKNMNPPTQSLNNPIQDLIIQYLESGSDWILLLKTINSLNVSENYIYKWYFETTNSNYILFHQSNTNFTQVSSYNALLSQYPGFPMANKIKCEIINTVTGETNSYIKIF